MKRAQGVFRELYGWLREQGIDSDTPLCAVRKEAGSIIFDQPKSFVMAAEFPVWLIYQVSNVEPVFFLESYRRVGIS